VKKPKTSENRVLLRLETSPEALQRTLASRLMILHPLKSTLFRFSEGSTASKIAGLSSRRVPRLIGMSFRQSIPWRVALQHCPPPLCLPLSFSTGNNSFASSFQRTATVPYFCLSQFTAQSRSVPRLFYACSEVVLSQLPRTKRCSACSTFFRQHTYTRATISTCLNLPSQSKSFIAAQRHGTRRTPGTTAKPRNS
jgi:hypothetical protein